MKNKKKKYAMVAINIKNTENNVPLIRRVLIRYKKYKGNVFRGTTFVEKDKYFYRYGSSHKYVFEDKCYYMTYSKGDDKYLIGEKRPYHWSVGMLLPYTAPILFEAETKEEAVNIFNSREELKRNTKTERRK